MTNECVNRGVAEKPGRGHVCTYDGTTGTVMMACGDRSNSQNVLFDSRDHGLSLYLIQHLIPN